MRGGSYYKKSLGFKSHTLNLLNNDVCLRRDLQHVWLKIFSENKNKIGKENDKLRRQIQRIKAETAE